MSTFLANIENKALSTVQAEQNALPMVSMTMKSIAGVEMGFMAHRITRQLKKYLSGRLLDVDSLDEEIANFIATWVHDDQKFSDWYDNQDFEQVHNTAKDLAYKSQMETLNQSGRIQSKELTFAVTINSSAMSPYRAGQRIMKPIRARLTELSEELRDFNCNSIDVQEQHDLLIEKINSVLDELPELVGEGLEEMANSIDMMVHDYRND